MILSYDNSYFSYNNRNSYVWKRFNQMCLSKIVNISNQNLTYCIYLLYLIEMIKIF